MDTVPPQVTEQAVERIVADPIAVPIDQPSIIVAEPVAAAPPPAPARRRILLPTKGHVDLAVAAAAELARLTSEQLRGRRIAVHVVVTSDDGRSVEADAIIEDSS